MRNNITFIGVGYVGLITSLTLALKNKKDNFICFDIDTNKINKLIKGEAPFYEPQLDKLLKKVKNIKFTNNLQEATINVNIFFICVPTPLSESDEWDLSYLFNAIDSITKLNKECTLVIKSTVPIGTCEKIQNILSKDVLNKISVVNIPEFLAQGSAIKDASKPNRIIIGYDQKNKYVKNVINLFSQFDSPILEMSTKASEMSKIAANNFLATKLSFINEISNICRNNNIKSSDVINSLKFDQRIGKYYLKPGVGYGGSCLPKDSKSLYSWSKQNGYDSKIIKATIDVNQTQKVILCHLLEKQKIEEKNIAILGLSFKSGTDDIRDSSAIESIKFLLNKNYQISVYDPKAIETTKKIFKDKLSYCHSIEDCIKNKSAVLIFCDWENIKKFDLKKYLELMQNPLIIDGCSIFTNKKIPNKIKYLPLNF